MRRIALSLSVLCLLPVLAAAIPWTSFDTAASRVQCRGAFPGLGDALVDLSVTGATLRGTAVFAGSGQRYELAGVLAAAGAAWSGHATNSTGDAAPWRGAFDRRSGAFKGALVLDGGREVAFTLERIAVTRGFDKAKTKHVKVTGAWPEFSGYAAPVRNALNALLAGFVATNAAAFGKDYAETADNPPRDWNLDIGYRLLAAGPRVVSIAFDTYQYTGGAHPNHGTTLLNFRVDGARPAAFRLRDVLRPGKGDALLGLVRAKLATKKAGWPEQVQLAHLDNAAFTPDGVTFHFDPYVAGCYAEGDYVVTLPWGLARQFIDKARCD